VADARLHALQLDVAYERTDTERRLHALQLDVAIDMARTWGDIADATKMWIQTTNSATARTVYFRKEFTVGPGYISGGTLTLQADLTCTIYINGSLVAIYAADSEAVTATEYTILRQKLRGGTNYLAFKLVSEAGLRGMLEFKLAVS
jgi:hypothetical protein